MKLPKPPEGYEWDRYLHPLSPKFDTYMLKDSDGSPVYECYVDLYHQQVFMYHLEIRSVIRRIKKAQKKLQPWKGKGLFT